MTKPKAVLNWSGGKDSALALHKTLAEDEFEVRYLLTNINSDEQKIAMHGVRRELLQKQAETIGIELIEVFLPEMPKTEVYEKALNKTYDFLIEDGVTHSIFGDIFLQDLREYREEQLKRKNVEAVFPLWQIPTENLIREFIDLKFEAIVVCVDAVKLDKSFCGRLIDESFVRDLPSAVDVCGENGEFHTFVFAAPFFDKNLEMEIGEINYREYPNQTNAAWSSRFYFCDLLLKK